MDRLHVFIMMYSHMSIFTQQLNLPGQKKSVTFSEYRAVRGQYIF